MSTQKENRLVVTFNVGSATLKIGVYRDIPSYTDDKYSDIKNPLQFSVNMDLKQASCKWKGSVPEVFDHFRISTKEDNVAQDSALNFLKTLSTIYKNEKYIFVHRVVHGGEQNQPVQITDEVLAKLHNLAHLAPLHQPPALAIIDAINEGYTSHDFIQVAAFDTAFHAQRPRLWYEYALPKVLRDEGVRSYGFHGLSYQSIMRTLHAQHPDLTKQRIIIAHLGSGCSITSVGNGQSTNSTLGFSGLDGVPMGTRSGHLDPGVLLYLMEKGWTHKQITQCLYKESGLLGLSGISNDVRELTDNEDGNAYFALDHFSAHAAKEISGLIPSINGLDCLIFTAGIGEHQANVREQIIEYLRWFDICIDTQKNHSVDLTQIINDISHHQSKVRVLVIQTDEQYELFQAAKII